MKKTTWILISGVSSLALGLLYLFNVLGPTKLEITIWAWTALALGALLLVTRVALDFLPHTIGGILRNLVTAGVAMIQPLPTYLWIAFHGRPVPKMAGDFTAHWVYTLPHLFVLGTALAVLFTSQEEAETDDEADTDHSHHP